MRTMSKELAASLPDSLEQYLPLEKSWYVRLGLQDLITENPRTIDFLATHDHTLSDDLKVVRDTPGLPIHKISSATFRHRAT